MNPAWKTRATVGALLAGLLLPAGCRTGGSRDSAVSIPANELRLLLDSFNKDFSTAI
ncbi:MAG: hypothetical protein ACI80N_004063, partial [Gammaproteobacteria bacterium]